MNLEKNMISHERCQMTKSLHRHANSIFTNLFVPLKFTIWLQLKLTRTITKTNKL